MSEIVENTVLIFCDGACSGNPGPGGWGAIIATPQGKVWELGGSSSKTTNNQMEITAALEALIGVSSISGPVSVHTDSVYVIRGITQWIWGWRKNGWRTSEGKDVANRDLWEKLSAVVATRGKEAAVNWNFVRGHSGVPGNERCDEIAVAFCNRENPNLYRGSLLKYQVALYDLPESVALPEIKPKAAKTQAFSYLSLLGNRLERHSSWAECERRVRGQSGAKFKKALSEDDEKAIIHAWGLNPNRLKIKS